MSIFSLTQVWQNVRIIKKIPILICAAVAVASLTTIYVGNDTGRAALDTAIKDKLSALVSSRAQVLSDYLDTIHKDL